MRIANEEQERGKSKGAVGPGSKKAPDLVAGGFPCYYQRELLPAGLRAGRGGFDQQAGHLRLQGLQRGVVGFGLGGMALQGGVLCLEDLNLLLLHFGWPR